MISGNTTRGFGLRRLVTLSLLLALHLLAVTPAAANDAKPTAKSIQLITLGTGGGPGPEPDQARPASAIIVDGKPYLIDAGNGVANQLAKAKVNLTTIDTIFVTHHHDDHNADLGTVMGLSWDRRRAKPVNAYGPPGTKEILAAFVSYFSRNANIRNSDVRRPIEPKDFFIGHDIESSGQFFKDENVTVTAVENTHFSGFKPGTPAHGKDKSFAFRFDIGGKSIVFTGDTGYSEAVIKLAKDADIFVSEGIDPAILKATLKRFYVDASDEQLDKQMRHFLEDHVSPEEIGKMATAANVKKVVISHYAKGPSDDGYLNGVKMHFKGEVFVAKDLQVFNLE